MKAKLRCLHRLLALGLGGWLCLWLLAGSALLWQEAWQTPKAPLPKGDEPIALAKLLAAAQSRHPEPGVWRLVLPRQPGEAVQAVFVTEDLLAEIEPIVLWLDAQTAQILDETPFRTPFWQALYRFHSSFLLGDRGRFLVIASGLVLVGLLASGLSLWQPRKPVRSPPSLRHRVLGMLIFPPLLISLVSGLALSLPASWLGAPPAPQAQAKLALASLTLDSIVRQMPTLFPGYELREIVVPQVSDEPWELALHRPGTLEIEPAWLRFSLYPDGSLERQAVSFRQWVYAFHTGQVAGIVGQVVLMLGGVGFAVQAMYGLRLWWQRARFRAPASRARGHKQQIA